MQTRTTIRMHWALCAGALASAGWLVVLGFWQLDAAFARGDLTRQTLLESLTYLAGVLSLLWAAGWVVASRPKPAPRAPAEGYTYT